MSPSVFSLFPRPLRTAVKERMQLCSSIFANFVFLNFVFLPYDTAHTAHTLHTAHTTHTAHSAKVRSCCIGGYIAQTPSTQHTRVRAACWFDIFGNLMVLVYAILFLVIEDLMARLTLFPGVGRW
jgi:hypothetical protein